MSALQIDTGSGAEPDDEIIYIWPECQLAWHCWRGVRTQWLVGMGGATGLNYDGVRAYLDEQRLRGRKRREIFECIQAGEQVALDVWAEQRELDRQAKPPSNR